MNIILLCENGRTWQRCVSTGWIKAGSYIILVLLLTSGAGLFGSFLFWQKMTRISLENHALQSRIADMQPRLDRLLIFERILHEYDQQQTMNVWQRHASPRAEDVGMDFGFPHSDLRTVSAFPWMEKRQASVVFSEAAVTAPGQETATDQVRETALDSTRNEIPEHALPNPVVEDDLSVPDHELPQSHAPDGTADTFPPVPARSQEPTRHLAEADNIQLSQDNNNVKLRFDLHNRSDTTIAGWIEVSFIARNDQIVQAKGDQRALRFRIQNFREVHSPLQLPENLSIQELLAMRIEVVSRTGDLLYTKTYPLAELLSGAG